MILVQNGSFIMGSDDKLYWDEVPMHEAVISQPFYISEELVRIEQFMKY